MKNGNRSVGGGPRSKVNRTVGNRTGAPREALNVRGVSQIGQSLGNKGTDNPVKLNPVEPVVAGRGTPSVLGNAKALDVGGGGVGKGRALYGKSGTNQTYGTPAAGQGRIANTKGEWPD
jgi:hypothetical protein